MDAVLRFGIGHFREPGYFSGSCIFMDNPLFGGFGDDGFGRVQIYGIVFVSRTGQN